MIVQTITLNLIPNNKPIVVNVNQNDEGDGRLVFEMDEAYGLATIQGTRPDGGHFEHPATLSGNTVTADLYADMTLVDGDVFAQLVCTENNERTGSQVFILRVQKEAKE